MDIILITTVCYVRIFCNCNTCSIVTSGPQHSHQVLPYIYKFIIWRKVSVSGCNLATGRVASELGKKTAMGQAKQDPDLSRSESNVLGKVQSHLCLTEWQGKSKCQQGKSA